MSVDVPQSEEALEQPQYRAEAVAAMESVNNLDELLPVTKLRTWLAAIAAALLIAGGIAYAAVTPRDVTVAGEGRITGRDGVLLVTSSAEGQFGDFILRTGTQVRRGQVIGYVVSDQGRIPQRAQIAGTLLGYLPRPGDPIDVGEWLAEVSNHTDDGRTALMTISPEEVDKVVEGQPVTVRVFDGPDVRGHVGPARLGAVRADRVQEGLGLIEPPDGPRAIIEVLLDEPAPGGYEFQGTVLVSERTLLDQLLGRS